MSFGGDLLFFSLGRGVGREELMTGRIDTNFVNGTKLVNVAELSRGKRHTILKKEKVRSLFKTGAHTLKGVW